MFFNCSMVSVAVSSQFLIVFHWSTAMSNLSAVALILAEFLRVSGLVTKIGTSFYAPTP